MSNRRGAFTIVELLVVMSIIAVLIALLIPAISKAREQAKYVLCMSNLRQNIVALNGYLSDSDDWLPLPWSSAWDGFPVAITGGKAYNQGLLYPYLNNNASTLFCPDMIEAVPGSWKMFTDPRGGAKTFQTNWTTKTLRTYTSYGMPRRWDDFVNLPTPLLSGGVYDIFKQQQDIQGFVAHINSNNMPPWSKRGRYYPIMACLQQWSAGGIAAYGAHNAERSNYAYSDGVVKPLVYSFRAAGVNMFASSATWAIYTNMR